MVGPDIYGWVTVAASLDTMGGDPREGLCCSRVIRGVLDSMVSHLLRLEMRLCDVVQGGIFCVTNAVIVRRREFTLPDAEHAIHVRAQRH